MPLGSEGKKKWANNSFSEEKGAESCGERRGKRWKSSFVKGGERTGEKPVGFFRAGPRDLHTTRKKAKEIWARGEFCKKKKKKRSYSRRKNRIPE